MNKNNRQQAEDATEEQYHEVLKSIKISRVMLPIFLALAVVGYLFWRDFKVEELANAHWTSTSMLFVTLAVVAVGFRHFFYMWRLRVITDGFLSWRKCFTLILIWEFSSAITPTSAGGAGVALFALAQEKLPAGRTTALVILTIILDTFFFVTTVGILALVYGKTIMGPGAQPALYYPFFLALSVLSAYGLLLIWGVFVNPTRMKRFLFAMAKGIKILNRFKRAAVKLGNEMVQTSTEIQQKPRSFFIKLWLITAGSWSSRFAVIICLILAFIGLDRPSQDPDNPMYGRNKVEQVGLIYARQVTLYMVMEITPTPGGVGLADLAFKESNKDIFEFDDDQDSILLIIGQIWRLLTYYIYLFVGAIVVPTWIRGVINRRREKQLTNRPN